MPSPFSLGSKLEVFAFMAGLTGLLGAGGLAPGGQTGLLIALGMAATADAGAYSWSSEVLLRTYRTPVAGAREAMRQLAFVPLAPIAAPLIQLAVRRGSSTHPPTQAPVARLEEMSPIDQDARLVRVA